MGMVDEWTRLQMNAMVAENNTRRMAKGEVKTLNTRTTMLRRPLSMPSDRSLSQQYLIDWRWSELGVFKMSEAGPEHSDRAHATRKHNQTMTST